MINRLSIVVLFTIFCSIPKMLNCSYNKNHYNQRNLSVLRQSFGSNDSQVSSPALSASSNSSSDLSVESYDELMKSFLEDETKVYLLHYILRHSFACTIEQQYKVYYLLALSAISKNAVYAFKAFEFAVLLRNRHLQDDVFRLFSLNTHKNNNYSYEAYKIFYGYYDAHRAWNEGIGTVDQKALAILMNASFNWPGYFNHAGLVISPQVCYIKQLADYVILHEAELSLDIKLRCYQSLKDYFFNKKESDCERAFSNQMKKNINFCSQSLEEKRALGRVYGVLIK